MKYIFLFAALFILGTISKANGVSLNKKCSVPLKFVGGILCQNSETVNLKPYIKTPTNINAMTSISFKLLKTISKTGGGFCSVNDIIWDKDPSLNYDFWIKFGRSIIDLKSSGKDSLQIELSVVDGKGCTNLDTAWFYIISEPKIEFGVFHDLCISAGKVSLNQICNVNPIGGCWKEGLSLFKVPQRILKGIITCDTINTLLLNQNDDTGKYIIRYIINYEGCYALRDTQLKIISAPYPSINMFPTGNNGKFCESDSNVILFANPKGGHWSSTDNGLIVDNKFLPSSVSAKYKDQWIFLTYTYTDTLSGCDNSKYLKVYVQSKPTIKIITPPIDTIFHEEINFKLLANYSITNKITWIHDFSNDGHFENNKPFSNNNPAIFTLKPNIENQTNVIIRAFTESIGDCPFFFDSLKIKVQPKTNNLVNLFSKSYVNIYPNPSEGNLNIEFLRFGNYCLKIFNNLGLVVLQKTVKGEIINNISIIQPPGIYTIEIIDDMGGSVFEKVIIK